MTRASADGRWGVFSGDLLPAGSSGLPRREAQELGNVRVRDPGAQEEQPDLAGVVGTPEMAARAYYAAAFHLMGRSAVLNFLDMVASLPRPASSSRREIQLAAAKAAAVFPLDRAQSPHNMTCPVDVNGALEERVAPLPAAARGGSPPPWQSDTELEALFREIENSPLAISPMSLAEDQDDLFRREDLQWHDWGM
ncbi:Ethylene-responsive transcription factor [Nymphaea thermarum]|nr:Ethylene-responsive transcription factor [Nymphaea thermarum]